MQITQTTSLAVQSQEFNQYLVRYQDRYGKMPKLLAGETLSEYNFRKWSYLTDSAGFRPTEEEVLVFLPIIQGFVPVSFDYPINIFTLGKWRWFLEEIRHFSDELLAYVNGLLK